MLIGRHDSKIDEKGRISFPTKFRKHLGDKLIITQGFESSLIVVSEASMKLLVEGTAGLPITDKEARDTETFLLGVAEEVTLDGKGRFVVPKHLRSYAGLTNEVSCLGVQRYVRIWDKKRWEEYNQGLVKNIEEITKRLGEK